MTAGEKKSSDLSSRLKRPLRSGARSLRPSSSSNSTIGAAPKTPPKAAIATGSAKEELPQRKNLFNEMLRHKPPRDETSNGPNSESIRDEIRPGQHVGGRVSGEMGVIPRDVDAADKIASLERALKKAEDERNGLREELERTKHHGQVYLAPTESYGSAPAGTGALSPGHSSRQSSSDMEYEMGSPLRRSLSTKRDEAIEQNYKLREKVAELQEQLVEQDAIFKSRIEQRLLSREHDWNELTRRLHHAEKESQDRLRQLLDLKQSISALTRMESQVTDSELAETAEKLFHRIREWVISNFRRTKLRDVPLASRHAAQTFEAIYPEYMAMDPSDRLPFFQSIIAHSLMHIFDENFCVGLPSSGPLVSLRQAATYINNAGSAYGEWRRATIRALENSEQEVTLQKERADILHRMLEDIEHELFTLTSATLPSDAKLSLLHIMESAADMQHTLLLQRAQYRLHFFRHGGGERSVFDAARMESINDFDDDDPDEDDGAPSRTFKFCVFPCLEKHGDEFGEKSGIRNVLLRAKVSSGVG